LPTGALADRELQRQGRYIHAGRALHDA
jgi:hypothetical protein